MQRKKSIKPKSESLLTGSLIAVFIIATPYLFYLYEGFPDIPVWETDVLGIHLKYTSGFYKSVNVTGWILFGKFIPLILLLIWFFTCRHWWYHALLIPICMYVFQIYMTLNDDNRFTDSSEFIVLAPLILVMLVFMYTIRTKIFDRIHNIDLTELDRVSLNGQIKKKSLNTQSFLLDDSTDEEDEEEDEEPLFMG